jgi:hypothetical protein
MRDQKLILPKKTILALFAGVFLLGIVGFLLLFPVFRDMNRMDGQIARAKTRLAVKKELYPEYSRLLKMQQAQQDFKLVPFAEKTTRVEDISIFGQTIASLCARTGMDFVAATPSPESIRGAEHTVLVDVVVRGDFLRFRDFLLQLLQVTSLDRVQQIKIRSIPEDREYGLKLWVGLH